MLNSAEHEILNTYKCENLKKFIFQAQISLECYFFLLIDVKMTIIVGILIYMTGKISCSAELSMKFFLTFSPGSSYLKWQYPYILYYTNFLKLYKPYTHCCTLVEATVFDPDKVFQETVLREVTIKGNSNLIRFSGGWMDDLRFYILFNSISVISGWWAGDNVQWNAVEGRWRGLKPGTTRSVGGGGELEPGTTRSVGQCLTYWATRAARFSDC